MDKREKLAIVIKLADDVTLFVRRPPLFCKLGTTVEAFFDLSALLVVRWLCEAKISRKKLIYHGKQEDTALLHRCLVTVIEKSFVEYHGGNG